MPAVSKAKIKHLEVFVHHIFDTNDQKTLSLAFYSIKSGTIMIFLTALQVFIILVGLFYSIWAYFFYVYVLLSWNVSGQDVL